MSGRLIDPERHVLIMAVTVPTSTFPCRDLHELAPMPQPRLDCVPVSPTTCCRAPCGPPSLPAGRLADVSVVVWASSESQGAMVQIGLECTTPDDPGLRLSVGGARGQLLALVSTMSASAASPPTPPTAYHDSTGGLGVPRSAGQPVMDVHGAVVRENDPAPAVELELPERPPVRECVVCMDAARSKRFEPCGHTTCCAACVASIVAAGQGCPTCRAAVSRITDANPGQATFFPRRQSSSLVHVQPTPPPHPQAHFRLVCSEVSCIVVLTGL